MRDRYSSDIFNLGDIDDVDTSGVGDDFMLQYNSATGKWESTANPVGPADGQFGFWVRDSATGIVTLATNTDDLNIVETIIGKRALFGGVS